SPVQGNLHAGFLKEEGDGNIPSLFNWGTNFRLQLLELTIGLL
ncbi:hypothetical protein LCGC14_1991170, partial [marine sediment metagenome]